MPLRAFFPALTVLVLLSLLHNGSAVPTLRSPLSRGIFDFFTSSEPSPLPSASTSVADLTEFPVDSAPEDEASALEPSPSLSPLPTSTPIVSLSPSPIPSATPFEAAVATETPAAEEDAEEQVPEETPFVEPTPSPSPAFVVEGALNPEELFAPETDTMGDDDDAKTRSSGAAQVASTASAGISVVALVAIAVAVLAPALLIYYGIRRRQGAGFNAMPATQADTSTYRPASQFSVGE